ncbi:MAG TPA: DNA polymerase Y family protein [Candidatus Acidoferrales bacterium]|nr:DNA polymerase Y family protein [Candidatus Acidoferrales bacterium]
MPIVCALVPCYKVEVARLEEPALRASPVLVADRLERGHVIDLDARAYALGARIGMTLLQAGMHFHERAQTPRIVVDDPARDRAVWEEVLDALDAASPLVEDTAQGTALVEMRGISGTPERWLAIVREALAEIGLPFAVALAHNRFVARVAALVADGTLMNAENVTAFLAPLPLHVLDLDEATIERLELLGIRTVGELAALPHGPFVRRFGPDAQRWHAWARGIDETPLIPRPRRLRIDRTLFGEGTAEREDQLLFALRTLIARVCDDVAYIGKRCGLLRLHLECEDGATHEILARLAQPTALPTTMFDLLRAKLEGTSLHAPVIGLRLGAERFEEAGSPMALFASGDPDPESVAIALARLDAALGEHHVLRARLQEGFRYESQFIYEPFVPQPLSSSMQFPAASGKASAPATFTLRLLPPRAIAVRLHHGVPAFVGGSAVVRLAGPWRVDESWWERPLQREEYDVLLTDGALLRITRENNVWFLRGTYD